MCDTLAHSHTGTGVTRYPLTH